MITYLFECAFVWPGTIAALGSRNFPRTRTEPLGRFGANRKVCVVALYGLKKTKKQRVKGALCA